MTFSTRPITLEEHPEFQRVADTQFLYMPDAQGLADLVAVFEPERSVAAFDDDTGRILGTLACVSMSLTVPGGARMPAGGIAEVGVLPTHRRQGILTSILRDHFADVVSRGELVCLLNASESSIYPRFGYGCFHDRWAFKIEARRATYLPGPQAVCDADPGSIAMLPANEWLDVLPALYTTRTGAYSGGVDHTPARWATHFSPKAAEQNGNTSGVYVVVHYDEHGVPDGYVAYVGSGTWTDGILRQTVSVRDLVALNRTAYLRLWRVVLDHDIVDTVEFSRASVDESLRWALADPRRLLTTAHTDGLYIRLVDVLGALNARTYRVAGSGPLAIAVTDRHLPNNNGTYVCAEGIWSRASLADTTAELSCDVGELSASYLGGQSFVALASVGRVTEITPGAAARADAIFLEYPRPPHSATSI